jgi:hypothetical protein
MGNHSCNPAAVAADEEEEDVTSAVAPPLLGPIMQQEIHEAAAAFAAEEQVIENDDLKVYPEDSIECAIGIIQINLGRIRPVWVQHQLLDSCELEGKAGTYLGLLPSALYHQIHKFLTNDAHSILRREIPRLTEKLVNETLPAGINDDRIGTPATLLVDSKYNGFMVQLMHRNRRMLNFNRHTAYTFGRYFPLHTHVMLNFLALVVQSLYEPYIDHPEMGRWIHLLLQDGLAKGQTTRQRIVLASLLRQDTNESQQLIASMICEITKQV